MDEQQVPQDAQGGGSDQFTQLVSNVTDGLAMLTDVLGSANPEAGSAMDGVSQAFKGVIEKMMSGGAAPAAQGQGMASSQVGAAKAVPAGPQGVVRG